MRFLATGYVVSFVAYINGTAHTSFCNHTGHSPIADCNIPIGPRSGSWKCEPTSSQSHSHPDVYCCWSDVTQQACSVDVRTSSRTWSMAWAWEGHQPTIFTQHVGNSCTSIGSRSRSNTSSLLYTDASLPKLFHACIVCLLIPGCQGEGSCCRPYLKRTPLDYSTAKVRESSRFGGMAEHP